MSFRYGMAQIKGGRETQEDFCISRSLEGIVPLSDEGARQGSSFGPIVLALCDGMGGHAAGEVAARVAATTFVQAFEDLIEAERPREILACACDLANGAIASEILSSPDLRGMGATLVGVFLDGDRVWWIGVGDSHLLFFRAGEVTALNQRHSMRAVLEEMIEEGEISAKEALSHPARNALLSVLNGDAIELIDAGGPLELQSGDVLLAASDGIDVIDMHALSSIVFGSSGNPLDLAEQIVSTAATAGGSLQDNTTVLVIEVE
jgi:serine/threonine protein phosphatase PrpC